MKINDFIMWNTLVQRIIRPFIHLTTDSADRLAIELYRIDQYREDKGNNESSPYGLFGSVRSLNVCTGVCGFYHY